MEQLGLSRIIWHVCIVLFGVMWYKKKTFTQGGQEAESLGKELLEVMESQELRVGKGSGGAMSVTAKPITAIIPQATKPKSPG